MSNRVATVVAVLALLLLISQIFIYCFYRQKSRLNQSLIRTSADILEQKEVISRQKDELETVNASKDQLFAIVGHDLRGPFASILQAMEVMKSGDLSDVELRTFLDNFHEKVTTTALMVDNLVFWAENQRNGTKTVPAETSLPKIVNQAITVFDYLTKGKEIEIQHDVRSVQPVWADPDQVRVIIHNLIGNAIKFTPQRGAISIGYNSMTDSVTVYIKDSGVGMPQEKLQKLFSVSGKAISSYGTNKETGIGIGLVLVKEFVEKNNADLEVDSKEGLGTEFRVRFPVVPSENAILQKRATD